MTVTRFVGRMPPESPTWRGRVGTRAVKLVKRLLFWYTPQIVRFQYSALCVFEEQAKALEMANQRLRELQRRQDEAREFMESHVQQLKGELVDERALNDALGNELQGLRTSMASTALQIEARVRRLELQPCTEERHQPDALQAPDHLDRSAP